MSCVAPRHIDLMGMGKALRIAVSGDDPEDDLVAPTNRRTIQIDIRGRRSGEGARKAGVSQQLVDGLLRQSRLLVQQAPLVRMLQESEPGISQQTRLGFARTQRTWSRAGFRGRSESKCAGQRSRPSRRRAEQGRKAQRQRPKRVGLFRRDVCSVPGRFRSPLAPMTDTVAAAYSSIRSTGSAVDKVPASKWTSGVIFSRQTRSRAGERASMVSVRIFDLRVSFLS